MRKITYQQACEILAEGKSVKCRVNKKEEVVIKTKIDLDAKKLLYEQGIQEFELFETEEKPEIPENAIEVTIEEAISLIAEYELVYCKINGIEEEINSVPSLIEICRTMKMRGTEPLVYWYVN